MHRSIDHILGVHRIWQNYSLNTGKIKPKRRSYLTTWLISMKNNQLLDRSMDNDRARRSRREKNPKVNDRLLPTKTPASLFFLDTIIYPTLLPPSTARSLALLIIAFAGSLIRWTNRSWEQPKKECKGIWSLYSLEIVVIKSVDQRKSDREDVLRQKINKSSFYKKFPKSIPPRNSSSRVQYIEGLE